MLELIDPRPPRPKCDGSTRRDFLTAGGLALGGLNLPALLHARAVSGKPARDRSVILLFLDGGASQYETFDPKTDIPKEYRSLFGSIPTKISGVHFGSHFPKMAKLADKLAVVRTLTHADGDHGGATHWMKTARPWPPEFLGKAPIIPQQHPSMGSIVARSRGPVNPTTGVPTYVRVLSNHSGYPGDDGVWLGQAYSPLRVGRGRGNPLLESMTLMVPPGRLSDRRALLTAFDRLDRTIDKSGVMDGMDGFQKQAVTVLTGRAREAFDLSREDVRTREKYGKGLGEELLLARRLCEAGAGFVTINNGYWDHHGGIVPGIKQLCPPLDHAVSTFIEDVEARGLEKDILLVVTGEFGRTPRINGGPGRDHWAPTNCAVLFGGGIRPGFVGETDAKAAYVKSRPVTPMDLLATIFQALGIDQKLQYVHPSGRSVSMIEDGSPIDELF